MAIDGESLQINGQLSVYTKKVMCRLDQVSNGRFFFCLALINIFFLFCRLQDTFPVLAKLTIPIILSVPMGILSLFYIRRIIFSDRVVVAMLGLLLFGALWVPFARNNYWALQTVRDLTQQFFFFMFPFLVLANSAQRIRRWVGMLGACGLYLGIYSATHKGMGPGGFLGDENDMCLMLDMLLVILAAVYPTLAKTRSKVYALFAVGVILVGIVATMSRGGFVGLLAGVGYLFYRSRYKIRIIFLVIVLGIAALIVAPSSYWKEMETITDPTEATAAGRLEIWHTGLKIWLDPSHILFGTGMGNVPHYLGDYESVARLGSKPSQAGRAVHSAYVQLLAELGLLGAFIFGVCVVGSVSRNLRQAATVLKLRKTIDKRKLFSRVTVGQEKQVSQEKLDEQKQKLLPLLLRCENELYFAESLLVAANAGFAAVLAAATFLSALYYPEIWLLVIFSVCCRAHAEELVKLHSELRELCFPNSSEVA